MNHTQGGRKRFGLGLLLQLSQSKKNKELTEEEFKAIEGYKIPFTYNGEKTLAAVFKNPKEPSDGQYRLIFPDNTFKGNFCKTFVGPTETRSEELTNGLLKKADNTFELPQGSTFFAYSEPEDIIKYNSAQTLAKHS